MVISVEEPAIQTGRLGLRHVVGVWRIGGDRLGPGALEVDPALPELQAVDANPGLRDLLVQIVVQRALDLAHDIAGNADATEVELGYVECDRGGTCHGNRELAVHRS